MSSTVPKSDFEIHVQEFLDYLQESRGLSSNTLSAYGNDIRQYADYLIDAGFDDWVVPSSVVNLFIGSLIDREYQPSSQARKLAAVKAMYRYLLDRGHVQSDPSSSLGSARVAKKKPKIISIAEIDRLLASASGGDSPEDYRDSAMLELLYATGMRVSEIVSLDVADIDLVEDCVTCSRGATRQRTISFGPRVKNAVLAYNRHGRLRLLRSKIEKAQFLNHRGNRLTRQGFWLIIKGHAARARISSHITPHTLRHSFAAHQLNASGSVPEVQSMLGHASPITTQVYLDVIRDKDSEGKKPLPGSTH
tara:strand:- start:414 stop:1331 length:918 start_codon:yes stop_codon:yes gene_type:complete